MADSGRKGFYIFVIFWACLSLTGLACWYAGVPGVSPAGAACGVASGLVTLFCIFRRRRA
jgi:membrane associated rhomboid family serine protease